MVKSYRETNESVTVMTNKGGLRPKAAAPLFFMLVINSLAFLCDFSILRAQCRFHTANVVRNSQICNCALDLC